MLMVKRTFAFGRSRHEATGKKEAQLKLHYVSHEIFNI